MAGNDLVVSIPLDIDENDSDNYVPDSENSVTEPTLSDTDSIEFPVALTSQETQEENGSISSQSDFAFSSPESESESENDSQDSDAIVNPIQGNNAVLPEIDITNYLRDTEVEEDYENDWRWVVDSDKDNCFTLPFVGEGGDLTMGTDEVTPEAFFDELFDEAMWQNIADNTNLYVQRKITRFGGHDVFQQVRNGQHHPRRRLLSWKDISSNDVKIFVAHLIIMGIVKKPQLWQYWSKDNITSTPFFGKYMPRDKFCNILWNLHLVDDSQNPLFGTPGHDPLAKIRPFHEMCLRNFKHIYKPGINISIDEGCCPWKGRVRFRCYNPRKPSKFHIKLFQLSEAASGYIVAFDIYTGKNSCLDEDICIDSGCTVTTKTVLTLASNAGVLDKGYRIYFDNYYTSPELLDELLCRDTLACGTVRSNRKGLPAAISKAKLKPGECCFRRKAINDELGPMLALKWCDKRAVYILSTMHSAMEKPTGKICRTSGNAIYKPTAIVDYTKNMGGVDLSDQLMGYYHFLRPTVKWWRKLWVHQLNMLLMNAFILHSKFGDEKLSHFAFRQRIAEYLLKSCAAPPANEEQNMDDTDTRLRGRHFIERIPAQFGKRSYPLVCKVCFRGKKLSKSKGLPQRKKSTSFRCSSCRVPLCIEPCFRLYHEKENYHDYI